MANLLGCQLALSPGTRAALESWPSNSPGDTARGGAASGAAGWTQGHCQQVDTDGRNRRTCLLGATSSRVPTHLPEGRASCGHFSLGQFHPDNFFFLMKNLFFQRQLTFHTLLAYFLKINFTAHPEPQARLGPLGRRGMDTLGQGPCLTPSAGGVPTMSDSWGSTSVITF